MNLLRKKTGQATVEIILLGAVFIIIAQVALNQIKEGDYLKTLGTPTRQSVSNVIRTGSWNLNEQEAKKDHPNHLNRHFLWKPK